MALFAGFFWLNFSHTINGIYHIILSARVSFYDTIDGELAAAIGASTLSFGRTVSALVLVLIIWVGFDKFVKWFDFDAQFVDTDADQLRAENSEFIECLRASNQQLESLCATIELVSDNGAKLSQHQDRIVELRVQLEKLFQKTKKDPVRVAPYEENPTPDLFKSHRRVSKSNGRRLSRLRIPTPKF